MEKRTPHTRLSQVKKLVNAGQVRTTRSALLNADELGLDFDGMCNVIIGLSESDFYKSMTTHQSHLIWQDVYHAKWREKLLYVKFQQAGEYFVISFKEL